MKEGIHCMTAVLDGENRTTLCYIDAQGGFCGTVRINALESDFPSLTSLMVLESQQGRGIGTRLLEEACRICRAKGAKRVNLSVSILNLEKLGKWYENRGFRPVFQWNDGDVCFSRPTTASQAFLDELRDWQFTTFPGETPAKVFAHLLKEMDELAKDTAAPGELADVLMLACCLCFHAGIDPINAMRAKHSINVGRKWQTGPKGFRHVKEEAP